MTFSFRPLIYLTCQGRVQIISMYYFSTHKRNKIFTSRIFYVVLIVPILIAYINILQTNTGRTARELFSNPAKFSQICGVPEDLIADFHYLILALTCKYDIDAKKFGDLCRSWLARFYVSDIRWNILSSSMHLGKKQALKKYDQLCNFTKFLLHAEQFQTKNL